jgi:hypothetical protein
MRLPWLDGVVLAQAPSRSNGKAMQAQDWKSVHAAP